MGRGAHCKLHSVCRLLCCCNMLSVACCVVRCMLLRREETHAAAEVHRIDDALCIGTEEARHELSNPPAMVALRLATDNGKQARTSELTKSPTRDDPIAVLQRCSHIAHAKRTVCRVGWASDVWTFPQCRCVACRMVCVAPCTLHRVPGVVPKVFNGLGALDLLRGTPHDTTYSMQRALGALESLRSAIAH